MLRSSTLSQQRLPGEVSDGLGMFSSHLRENRALDWYWISIFPVNLTFSFLFPSPLLHAGVTMEAEGTMTFDRLGCPVGAKQAGHPKHWLSLPQGTLRGSAGSGFGAACTQRVQAPSCPGSLATAAGMVTAEPRAGSCEPLRKPLLRSSTSQPVGTSAGTLTQLHLLQ